MSYILGQTSSIQNSCEKAGMSPVEIMSGNTAGRSKVIEAIYEYTYTEYIVLCNTKCYVDNK